MTKEEAVKVLKNELLCVNRADMCDRDCGKCDLVMSTTDITEAYEMAINALSAESEYVTFEEYSKYDKFIGDDTAESGDLISRIPIKKRTDNERKSYQDGFEYCFKKFCECLEVEGVKAPETIRKMKVYRMGVMTNE